MGLSVRIFIVNDDDSIQRIPLGQYQRLLEKDSEEKLPQYAGKRMRYVEVALELEQRKPAGILRILYFIMPFDSKGRIDPVELEKERRLSMEMIPSITTKLNNSNVISAQHHFAQKRFDQQFRWKPTPEIKAAIIKAIFSNKQK